MEQRSFPDVISRGKGSIGALSPKCLLAGFSVGLGLRVRVLELYSDNSHHDCLPQEQHSQDMALLSHMFTGISFPDKDAYEASKEGNSTARQGTEDGGRGRLSASCAQELITGLNKSEFL